MSSASATPQRHHDRPSIAHKRTLTADPGSVRSNGNQGRPRRVNIHDVQGFRGERDTGGDGRGSSSDIDSPNFIPAAYYEDLTSKSSLTGLMKTASSLSADIGTLQGSRHALVYNHHHQLFSAGDTISKLNVRTPQLLSIVTSLQQSFSSISQLADSVTLPEGAKRPTGVVDDKERIIRKANRDLRKVQLMLQAKEPLNIIADTYNSVKETVDKAAAQDVKVKQKSDAVRLAVEGL